MLVEVRGEGAGQVFAGVVDPKRLDLCTELKLPLAVNNLERIEDLIASGQEVEFQGMGVIVEKYCEIQLPMRCLHWKRPTDVAVN
jgi:hypothetical protein